MLGTEFRVAGTLPLQDRRSEAQDLARAASSTVYEDTPLEARALYVATVDRLAGTLQDGHSLVEAGLDLRLRLLPHAPVGCGSALADGHI
jgi:hypothetical protein